MLLPLSLVIHFYHMTNPYKSSYSDPVDQSSLSSNSIYYHKWYCFWFSPLFFLSDSFLPLKSLLCHPFIDTNNHIHSFSILGWQMPCTGLFLFLLICCSSSTFYSICQILLMPGQSHVWYEVVIVRCPSLVIYDPRYTNFLILICSSTSPLNLTFSSLSRFSLCLGTSA